MLKLVYLGTNTLIALLKMLWPETGHYYVSVEKCHAKSKYIFWNNSDMHWANKTFISSGDGLSRTWCQAIACWFLVDWNLEYKSHYYLVVLPVILSWCWWNLLTSANQITQIGSCNRSRIHVPDLGGMGVWPGKIRFHTKCKNLVNINVYLITSLKSKWKN